MRDARQFLTIVCLSFLLAAAAARTVLVAPADGAVKGTAVDRSGGVLPGVTITAAASDGRILATTTTGSVGEYSLTELPTGLVILTFQLEGFGTTVMRVNVEPGRESLVLGRMDLAPLAETVVVRGRAPEPPPAPAPPPVPQLVLKPVPVHDRDSICAPAKAASVRESLGTIRSGRRADHALFAQGDELTIDGGTLTGLAAGQNAVVRRNFRVRGATGLVTGEHTSGLVQIVSVSDRAATAIVVYTCDTMMKGDFLATFDPQPIYQADGTGSPAYGDAARILFADEGRMLVAPDRMMVIDRGSEQGIYPGQRVTLFRRTTTGRTTPSAVSGEAIVVAVRRDSATIRVKRVTGGIEAGDWAAPHRTSVAAVSALLQP